MDTIFGATFLALAPEHALVSKWRDDLGKGIELNNFVEKMFQQKKVTPKLEEIEKEEYLAELENQVEKKNNLLKDKNHFNRKSKLAKYQTRALTLLGGTGESKIFAIPREED